MSALYIDTGDLHLKTAFDTWSGDASASSVWMSTFPRGSVARPLRRYDIGIAIPARNEAACIVASLAALALAVEIAGQNQVCVLVLVNNSRDDTAARARAFCSVKLKIRVVEVVLDQANAHAGGARRLAIDLVLDDLPDSGILMTTDADSCVEPDWLAANLAEIEAGADAVAGVVTFAPEAQIRVAASRHAEWRLARLHARLHSLLDPRPQARWPTHIWAWGASLAVTVAAYRAVGGLPAVPLAEDRAFADRLDRHGFCVRRSHAPVVVTSTRLHGRAPGGLATLIGAYTNDDMPCDAAIEPTVSLMRRLVWRARLQRRHAYDGAKVCARMVGRLGITRSSLSAVDGTTFLDWWAAIEQASPQLRRERVPTESLPLEIGRAERLVRLFECRTRRSDTAGCVDDIQL